MRGQGHRGIPGGQASGGEIREEGLGRTKERPREIRRAEGRKGETGRMEGSRGEGGEIGGGNKKRK